MDDTKIVGILMGGNACFEGNCAEPIVVHTTADRDLYQDRISHLFTAINSGIKVISGSVLWGDRYVVEDFLAGSSGHLFNPKISFEELVKVKRSFGDVDIQFDKDRLDDVVRFLSEEMSSRMITGFNLLGWSHTIDTVITVWRDSITGQNYQVDFEAVDFENGLPTEWSRFSRSSSWDDTRLYIKGFAHKYIFRAITARDMFDGWVKLKTKVVRRKIVPMVFSPKGARIKYRFVDSEFYAGGLYREIPMSESVLIRDIKEIYSLFFTADPVFTEDPEELAKMFSFCGVVDLIVDHASPHEYEDILLGMEHLLWGPGAQGIYRNDPKADFSAKSTAFLYMADKLGFAQRGFDEEVVDEYYRKY